MGLRAGPLPLPLTCTSPNFQIGKLILSSYGPKIFKVVSIKSFSIYLLINFNILGDLFDGETYVINENSN